MAKYSEHNIVKTIDVDCGRRHIMDDGTIIYEGRRSSEGTIYKDYNAFKSGMGICYISEYGLLYGRDLKVNDELIEGHFWSSLGNKGDTRKGMQEQVQQELKNLGIKLSRTEEILEKLFDSCQWAYFATYVSEICDWDFENEDFC